MDHRQSIYEVLWTADSAAGELHGRVGPSLPLQGATARVALSVPLSRCFRDSPHAPRDPSGQDFPWFIFVLMASVTFVGILSELVPSGVLPQMTQGLRVSESDVGFLVGVYALASELWAWS
jgi:hypothetical protein